jgi:hypothetical protein
MDRRLTDRALAAFYACSPQDFSGSEGVSRPKVALQRELDEASTSPPNNPRAR